MPPDSDTGPGPGLAAEAAASPRPVRSPWGWALSAGVAAGLIAWAGGEWVERANPFQIVSEHVVSGSVQLAQRAQIIITKSISSYGLFGGALGLLLGLAGGAARRSAVGMIAGGVVGLVLGALAGGGTARFVVPLFLRNENTTVADDLVLPLLTHGAIWLPLGAASGLALGVGLGGPARRWLYAGLGGLFGAIVATAVYELLGGMIFPLEQTGQPISAGVGSRLFARLVVALGVAAGTVLLTAPDKPAPCPPGPA